MVLHDILSDTWFLADIAFWGGATLAFNTNSFKAFLKQTALNFNQYAVMGGKENPQRVEHSLNIIIPSVAYNIIKYIMLFSFLHNSLYMYFVPENPRFALINLFYSVYSLSTALKTARDVLLDDDIAEFSPDAKRRHVLFPVNIEDTKVFPERLQRVAVDKQLLDVERKLRLHMANAFFFVTLVLGAYSLLGGPGRVLALLCCLPAHRSMLLFIDHALDALYLRVYRNRYDHYFGDIWAPVHNDDAHDDFGRQYQYFNYSNKPLEKTARKHFFLPARKQYKMSVAEAKVAYYLGRGLLAIAGLLMLNLIEFSAKGIAPVAAYYAAHALFAYKNHGVADKGDDEPKRTLIGLVEVVGSGLLIYLPILDHLVAY